MAMVASTCLPFATVHLPGPGFRVQGLGLQEALSLFRVLRLQGLFGFRGLGLIGFQGYDRQQHVQPSMAR